MNKDPFPWEARPAIRHSIREEREQEALKSDEVVWSEAGWSLVLGVSLLMAVALLIFGWEKKESASFPNPNNVTTMTFTGTLNGKRFSHELRPLEPVIETPRAPYEWFLTNYHFENGGFCWMMRDVGWNVAENRPVPNFTFNDLAEKTSTGFILRDTKITVLDSHMDIYP